MTYKIRLETQSGDVKWRKGPKWVSVESLADTWNTEDEAKDTLESLFTPIDAHAKVVER